MDQKVLIIDGRDEEQAARESIKNGSDHGQNIVIVDEAHFKNRSVKSGLVLPRQNTTKEMYISENEEYSDYAIPKIISNLSGIQQNKQNIIQTNQKRNNNSSAKSTLERQLEDMTSHQDDLKKKKGIAVALLGKSFTEMSLSLTEDDLMAMRRIAGIPTPSTNQSREIQQLRVNVNEEREKTRNALYSRVKQTPESNSILEARPDSSPILVQQSQTGQGKTAIVKQFWKQASFDAISSELIQQSSRLVIGANEFIYDRATFVNQSKVRSALGLIKDIDEFIAKLTGILNSSPVDGQPLPNLSEFPQYAAMSEVRRDLVDAFCSRVAPMYGKPRERADRLILEMPRNYQIELTEKINNQL